MSHGGQFQCQLLFRLRLCHLRCHGELDLHFLVCTSLHLSRFTVNAHCWMDEWLPRTETEKLINIFIIFVLFSFEKRLPDWSGSQAYSALLCRSTHNLTHGKLSETSSINEVVNLHSFPWEVTFIDSGNGCTRSNIEGLGSSRKKDLGVFALRHSESLWVRWTTMLMGLIDQFGQEPTKEVQSGCQTETFFKKLGAETGSWSPQVFTLPRLYTLALDFNDVIAIPTFAHQILESQVHLSFFRQYFQNKMLKVAL